jgi:hypothetical protein
MRPWWIHGLAEVVGGRATLARRSVTSFVRWTDDRSRTWATSSSDQGTASRKQMCASTQASKRTGERMVLVKSSVWRERVGRSHLRRLDGGDDNISEGGREVGVEAGRPHGTP